MFKPYIRLGRPSIKGNRVTFEVDCSQGVKAYLSTPYFWYESESLGDPHDIPESILVIPIVGNLATLAWALGADLHVDRLDAVYAESLGRVQQVFAGLYPAFPIRKSRLKVDEIETIHPPDAEGENRVGLLFSGGLDSTTSLIDHRDEVTDLFTVWGADVDIHDEALWKDGLFPVIMESDLTTGRTIHVVKSNLREGINERTLQEVFGPYLPGRGWWGAFQFGLALTSLTAPMSYDRSMERLLISSSRAAQNMGPWGSRPDIDNAIQWAKTSVVHSGYPLTRTDKIMDVYAPYVRIHGPIKLAVCYMPSRGEACLNCGACDECVRTVAGLMLAGLDPNECGFCPLEDALSNAIDHLRTEGFKLHQGTSFSWRELKRRTPSRLSDVQEKYGSHGFFNGLRDLDESRLAAASADGVVHISPTHRLFGAKRLGRRLPPIMQRRVRRVLSASLVRTLLSKL